MFRRDFPQGGSFLKDGENIGVPFDVNVTH